MIDFVFLLLNLDEIVILNIDVVFNIVDMVFKLGSLFCLELEFVISSCILVVEVGFGFEFLVVNGNVDKLVDFLFEWLDVELFVMCFLEI